MELKIDENYHSIIEKEDFCGRACIREEIYNPFGLDWVNHIFKDIHQERFKELSNILE